VPSPPSRFDSVTSGSCRGLVYYLWRFALPEGERAEGLDAAGGLALRDLVAAVRPWIDELEVALEREDLHPLERSALEDLGATWQAAFERLGGRDDRIKEGWDMLQVTGDRPLNAALWKLFRAEDLRSRALPGDDTDLEVQTLLSEGFHELTTLTRARTFPREILALEERFREQAVVAMRVLAEGRPAPTAPPEDEPPATVVDPDRERPPPLADPESYSSTHVGAVRQTLLEAAEKFGGDEDDDEGDDP